MTHAANPTTTHFPTPSDAGESFIQNGFKITTRKLPILKAGPIEEMTSKLGITPPEMIFGDNSVSIEHERTGWSINFNSFDALDRVDKTGEAMLKVSYSKEWQKNRYVCLGSNYTKECMLSGEIEKKSMKASKK